MVHLGVYSHLAVLRTAAPDPHIHAAHLVRPTAAPDAHTHAAHLVSPQRPPDPHTRAQVSVRISVDTSRVHPKLMLQLLDEHGEPLLEAAARAAKEERLQEAGGGK